MKKKKKFVTVGALYSKNYTELGYKLVRIMTSRTIEYELTINYKERRETKTYKNVDEAIKQIQVFITIYTNGYRIDELLNMRLSE